MSEYLLEMKGISKSFPGVKALQNVEFQLKAGEIHALLGENGAGKSTLIKVLGGIYIAEEGEILIDGKPVVIDGVHAARENGISIIHQELVLVPHMTVAENIFLGREPMGKLGVDYRKMAASAQEMLDKFDLGISATDEIFDLSIAQQQMVEIVKAISFNCRILVMDEPTSSISDRCDRVTVLRDGMYVGTRVVADTPRDELITMMVGRELNQYYTRDHVKDTPVFLKCEHIDDGKKHHKRVNDVSFEVREGEIVGFAGLVGAGRSETMQCIFGLTNTATGTITLEGKQLNIRSAVDAMKYGIAMVPENRKLEGLYHIQSVSFNTTIEVLQEIIHHLRVNDKREHEITQEFIDKMQTKTPSHEQRVSNLSGGNQQKVMIGRWLATKPKVLILDEPTRGVDVGAKAEIYEIMNELTKQGVAIIMVSSELPEIINMADRVYVMYDGRITGCIDYVYPKTHNTFLTTNNIFNVLRQSATNLMLACGMTMVIILGGIDLSVGSIIAMSGVLGAAAVVWHGLPEIVGILIAILSGLLFGLLNGTIIAKTKIPPFIVTLASMNIAKGIAYVYSGGKPIRCMTDAWKFLGAGNVAGIPTPVITMFIVFVVAVLFLNRSRTGRHIYAVGGNDTAAKFSAINTAKVKLIVYSFSGLMAGLAGITIASRLYSGTCTSGDGAEMDAIAAILSKAPLSCRLCTWTSCATARRHPEETEYQTKAAVYSRRLLPSPAD